MPQPTRQNYGRANLGGSGVSVRDYIGAPGMAGAGMSDLQAPQRDESFVPTPAVGGGSSAGLDIYGGGSPQARRDLKTDPLTSRELTGLGVAKDIIGRLPGGSIIGQAIDYNLGQYSAGVPGMAAPDSIGGQIGLNKALGLGTVDATRAAIEGLARTGWSKLSGAYNENYGNEEKRLPATPVEDEVPAGEGSGGFREGRYGGFSQDRGGEVDTNSRHESTSAFAADGGAVVPGGFHRGFADGGQVGLTGPMYDSMNRSPATLTQLGFADGGMVAGMGAQVQPEQIQTQVAHMVRNPQFQQVAQRAVGAAMQSGELTPEELVTLGRIAEAAMHNPQLYPQLRQFAAQNGMTPLPEAFDPKVIMVLMAASKMFGQTPPGQVPPTDVAQMQNPAGMNNGGYLQGPGTGRSDSIGTVEESTGKPVKVANGEYVIPKHVVDAKGREFFDKMLRQYAQITPGE